MTKALVFTLHSEQEMLEFGARLSHAITNGAVIFLYGQLGAGKTTLARGFLRGCGYDEKVKSPTYTLVEPYEVNDRKIFHFDFYRIETASELAHIGIQEYFFPEAICLIEWAENGLALLPEPDLTCYIELIEQGRAIRLEAGSEKGSEILQRL